MLQFITHTTDRFDPVSSAEAALQGGCRWIQLRMKEAGETEIRKAALRLRPLCRACGAAFILDDHVRLVEACDADGVHLGKNDMPVTEARRILGPDRIIGGTANRFEDIERLAAEGADYIGLGPFRFTETKKNLSPVLGLEGYREILQRMRDTGIELPVVAIGGVTAADIPDLMETGVTGIALSGAILQAADPVAETRRIGSILDDCSRTNNEKTTTHNKLATWIH